MYRDLRWVTLAETTNRVASIVTVPLLTRAFTPFRYGFYRTIFLVLSLFLTVEGILQLSTILEKRLPELDACRSRRLTVATMVTLLATSVLAFALFALGTELGLLAVLVPEFEGLIAPYLPVLGALFVAYPAYRVVASLCKGADRFDLFSVGKLVREVGFLLLVLGLFAFEAITIDRILWGYLAVTVLSVVVMGLSLRDLFFAQPDFAELLRQVRSIALPLVPKTLLKNVQGKVPDAIVLAAFGSVTFATWTILFTFVRAFQLFSQPFSQLFLSKISTRLAEDEPLDSLLLNYYRYSLVVSAPLVVGGAVMGSELIQHLFGYGYVTDPLVLVVLLVGFGLQTITVPAGSVFVATDNPVYASYELALRGSTFVVFTLVGAYVFDSLLVVAVGYSLGYVVTVGFSIWHQRQFVSTPRIDAASIGRIGLSLACMAVVPLLGRSEVSGLVSTVLVVVTGAVIYFVALYLTGFLNDRDVNRLKRLAGV